MKRLPERAMVVVPGRVLAYELRTGNRRTNCEAVAVWSLGRSPRIERKVSL